MTLQQLVWRMQVSKASSQDEESPPDENPALYRRSMSVFQHRVLAGEPSWAGRGEQFSSPPAGMGIAIACVL